MCSRFYKTIWRTLMHPLQIEAWLSINDSRGASLLRKYFSPQGLRWQGNRGTLWCAHGWELPSGTVRIWWGLDGEKQHLWQFVFQGLAEQAMAGRNQFQGQETVQAPLLSQLLAQLPATPMLKPGSWWFQPQDGRLRYSQPPGWISHCWLHQID